MKFKNEAIYYHTYIRGNGLFYYLLCYLPVILYLKDPKRELNDSIG